MDQTLEDYRNSLEKNPDAPDVWYNMAVLLQAQQSHEEALEAYGKAHELGLETPNSWYGVGYSQAMLGKQEAALDAFDRCVEQSRHFPEKTNRDTFRTIYAKARFFKGLILAELGKTDQAIEALDQVLQYQPDFREALRQRAHILLTADRTEEALAAWERVLQADPNSPGNWHVKSQILERLGRADEAREADRRGLELKEEAGQAATPDADPPAAIQFYRRPAEESIDGIGYVDFMVEGEVLFSMPHGPSACPEVGFNELVYYTGKALEDLSGAGNAHGDDSSSFSEVFVRLWNSLEKLPEEKRQAIMIRSIATVVAVRENEDVTHFLDNRPRGAYNSVFFAASQAKVRDDCTFDYDNLLEIADQRLTQISGEYETQKTLDALSDLEVTVPVIVQAPDETPGELAERMANPEFYAAPPDYQPPSDPLELLARYESGERYFHATTIKDSSMIEANLAGANLNKATLTDNNMRSSNLSGSHLIAANLANTNLAGSECVSIRLMDASMPESNLAYCNLQGARLRDADLEGADLQNADLTDASLSRANLKNADLRKADVTNAEFEGANLDHANLEDVRGQLWVDGNSIYRTRFSYNAPDPWSVLCRSYTGIQLVYHLIFLCLFVGGHAANIAYLVFLSEGQQAAQSAARGIEGTLPAGGFLAEAFPRYLQTDAETETVFSAAIGFARGYGTFLLTVLLILYNAGRSYLTKQVSLLKADQDRNHVSPRLQDYRRLYYLHKASLVLMFVSGALFIGNLYGWLTLPLVVSGG